MTAYCWAGAGPLVPRTEGEHELAQAISVDWAPRHIRTRPAPSPAVTTTWLWNTVRPIGSTATTYVTP